ncbi:lasso RiPP family leader peptide-containing protein [Tropicimonas sp. IMCC6043]|uniref:lasso RiPP family leader peptide-containing protein n=1 Tax=Tropicimonas sp. IMCC6043 TaxID=2510645 RepID=UPI00101D046B|nr:lasso RiPP family leader peptide-containing protein [Tropicimonas sp. IMCC6043]RYH07499.1 lasso RiPP family leader peptide-containing protein [Tropicimonas sp. IMCC6043]
MIDGSVFRERSGAGETEMQTPADKRPYTPPTLTVFGSVRELTHGQGNSGGDGSSKNGRGF